MPRRRSIVALTWLIFLGSLASAQHPVDQQAIDPNRYMSHVQHLASEEMRGRAAATPQLDQAADYIAGHFRAAGLATPAEGFYQPFPVVTKARLGPGNRLSYNADGEMKTLKIRDDFIPLKLSGQSRVTAPMVFAGYGISASEYGYDDYAGIDVAGKIVVMLRHEPQEHDRASPFAGRVYTEHSQLFSKVLNARLHQAAGVIMLNDTEQHGGSETELTEFDEYPGPAGVGIPFVHVSAQVAKEWFSLAGRGFEESQKRINRSLEPGSFAFPGSLRVTIETDVKSKLRKVRNVAGFLPGETSEYVIVGAHYDHIGLGEQYSMSSSSSGTIHPGADDNASGVAALIELAYWFASQPRPRRGILFLAFAAEELGLVGSSYYIRKPLLPLSDAVAMINMDMIGRIRDNKVYVGGAPKGSALRKVLERHSPSTDLELDFSDTAGYGSSDHTSFTARQIPTLFFFSGLHGDYHRPGDTWDRVTATESAELASFIARLTAELAQDASLPASLRGIEPPPRNH